MTTLQLPSSGSHSSVCSPDPLVDATQKPLVAGRRGRCVARSVRVLRVLPDVRHHGALDAVQVLLDVGVPGDADEDIAIALAADADVAEDSPRSPFGAAEVNVGTLRDDRVCRRGEVLARGHKEAVLVALGLIDHHEGRAARRVTPARAALR